jgi:hypothetical protein
MSCYALLPNTEMLSHLRFLVLKRRDHWRYFQSKHADTRSYLKDMPTCIIPFLPGSAWQEHGIVAPACALESTTPTSSRDRFSQHCAVMAPQLHVVVPPLVVISDLSAECVCTVKNLQHHEHCKYLMLVNNAMAGAPASAEFGQGRSQGRSQLGERRFRCLHRFLCASPRPVTLRVRSALAVCCQQDRSRQICAQGQFTSSLLQCQPAGACRQTRFHHSPWGVKWEVEQSVSSQAGNKTAPVRA